jgi:hypothetical protein
MLAVRVASILAATAAFAVAAAGAYAAHGAHAPRTPLRGPIAVPPAAPAPTGGTAPAR